MSLLFEYRCLEGRILDLFVPLFRLSTQTPYVTYYYRYQAMITSLASMLCMNELIDSICEQPSSYICPTTHSEEVQRWKAPVSHTEMQRGWDNIDEYDQISTFRRASMLYGA